MIVVVGLVITMNSVPAVIVIVDETLPLLAAQLQFGRRKPYLGHEKKNHKGQNKLRDCRIADEPVSTPFRHIVLVLERLLYGLNVVVAATMMSNKGATATAAAGGGE